MSTLLALVLALPVLGAVAVVVAPDHQRRIVAWTAATTAAGWAVLVAGSDPALVTLGRLEVDPMTACAAAGLAFLVFALPATTVLAASAALSGVTLFAAAASIAAGPGPDRPLGAGIALLAVLAVARFRSERLRLPGAVLAFAGGGAVAVGLALDDPGQVAVVVLVGAGAVVVATAVWATPGLLLFPAVVLAAARATAATDVEVGDVDLVAWVGVGVGLVGAIGLTLARRGSWVTRVALSGVLASLVVLAQDVADLRAAGLLLAAGATLALIGGHPVALVGLAPGVHALAGALGLFQDRGLVDVDGPEAAAAGAALAALVLVALLPDRDRPPDGDDLAAGVGVPALVAAAFGVVPLWSWSGARTDGYVDAWLVAAAVALAVSVALATTVLRRLPAAEEQPVETETETAAPVAEPEVQAEPTAPPPSPDADAPSGPRPRRTQLQARPRPARPGDRDPRR